MKARTFSKFLAIAAMLSGSLFLIGWDQPRIASSVKFKLLRDYVIVIPVTVNGAGPYQFLLDTGSNTTLVSTEFARMLGLRPIDRIELVTTTGSQIVPRARVERLAVCAKSVPNVEVLFSDLRAVRSVEPAISGVLGQNVLTQFNYLLDYRARQITIEEDDELESSLCGERQPIELHEGRMLATAQGGLRLVLDSGISTSFLFGRNFELDWVPGKSQSLVARSDLGSRTVEQRRVRSFTIGSKWFSDLPVTLMDAKTASEARIEDGLLPTNLFRNIYFNHRKGFVIFNSYVAPAALRSWLRD